MRPSQLGNALFLTLVLPLGTCLFQDSVHPPPKRVHSGNGLASVQSQALVEDSIKLGLIGGAPNVAAVKVLATPQPSFVLDYRPLMGLCLLPALSFLGLASGKLCTPWQTSLRGWQKPIVLVFPGFRQSPKTWESFRLFLQNVKGRMAFAVDYSTVNTRPVSEMVTVAKKHIEELIRQHPREFSLRGVILFGHSLGGLVAREFLGQMSEGDWQRAPARKLVTVGTPNAGFYTPAHGVSGALVNCLERAVSHSNTWRRSFCMASLVNDPYRPHEYSRADTETESGLQGLNAVALVNNEVQGALGTADGRRRRANMLRLRDGVCVIGSEKDERIRPVESQIFGFYALAQSPGGEHSSCCGLGGGQRLKMNSMEDTALFKAKDDPIGLRALDAKGKLVRVWRRDVRHQEWCQRYDGIVEKLPRGDPWLEQNLDLLSPYLE